MPLVVYSCVYPSPTASRSNGLTSSQAFTDFTHYSDYKATPALLSHIYLRPIVDPSWTLHRLGRKSVASGSSLWEERMHHNAIRWMVMMTEYRMMMIRSIPQL
ncbi:hypothetical protein CY34DRAFT_696728 [Suillus luteus UH-Slu-Lm8-n1]|uniref:Uncharacterized protein n=1 Tax=Suillus luteus UH-Slu-Lm8-n1 TaxID=930992 RepID=A0A0C9ZVY8_9AGAM|nr:hypothetical protein CY34DRAFT_696728 [Suillus luteus UH-Slu-Lm8-n1]